MEKIELSNETKDYLLNQLFEYRYAKENNICALKELKRIIEIINSKFSDSNNAFLYESSRIKEENSFLNKIYKKIINNQEIGIENIHDIVGLRLEFLTISDIYKFLDILRKSNLIKIVDEKDYIENPKESGYTGYHLIVKVPTLTPTGIKEISCEIQLRTLFMDIFAREEHILSYKGYSTPEDKKILRILSDELFSYDCATNNLYETKNQEKLFEENNLEQDKELLQISQEYDKISYLYDLVYEELNKKIKEFVSEYENSSDVIHVVSRIKSLTSLKRKLKKRNLEYKAEDILYNIRDVVGFKIVCRDKTTTRDFINYFTNRIKELEKIEISEVSDRLDNPKESGYRGYRMNLSYYMPTITGNQTITVELLVRTKVMDAWALHHDKIFNDENAKETTKRNLKGLSPALNDIEDKLSHLKINNSEESSLIDLVSEVEEYQIGKKSKQLTMSLIKDENN